MKKILGIDPGLNKTGWGVIAQNGNNLSFIAGGTIKTNPKEGDPARLAHISAALKAIVDEHRPEEAAVEEVFVNTNAKTSLKLGQARGVALLVPHENGLQVSEYTALQVKKAVVGYGRAEKAQIGTMVKILLPTAQITGEDMADALAIAITHAHSLKL